MSDNSSVTQENQEICINGHFDPINDNFIVDNLTVNNTTLPLDDYTN
jgi:hypothetical protein